MCLIDFYVHMLKVSSNFEFSAKFPITCIYVILTFPESVQNICIDDYELFKVNICAV